jgi:hypothetical protein
MPFPLNLPRYDQQEASETSDDDEDNENEDPMGLAEKEDGWQAPRIGSIRYSVDIYDVTTPDLLIVRAPETDHHSFTVGNVDTPLWLCKVLSHPKRFRELLVSIMGRRATVGNDLTPLLLI